jgi:hypothetical protein
VAAAERPAALPACPGQPRPLLAVHLDAGQVAEAVAAGRQLLHNARPRLPADLESPLAEACQAWDPGQPGLAGERLAAAVALARDLNYC